MLEEERCRARGGEYTGETEHAHPHRMGFDNHFGHSAPETAEGCVFLNGNDWACFGGFHDGVSINWSYGWHVYNRSVNIDVLKKRGGLKRAADHSSVCNKGEIVTSAKPDSCAHFEIVRTVVNVRDRHSAQP